MARPKKSPAVWCAALSKSFGPVKALAGIDLEVPAGVTFGLVGPNGAGKTTLMRILLGLTVPSAGKAQVLGEPLPPRRALPRIGYMPQDLAIYPDLTVNENLALFGRLVGMDEARITERAAEVLDLVDLSSRRGSLLSTLSGGMRRRTSLAAALLHDPELLLLDEPTVGVDPELRAEFWVFFDSLKKRGRTIVITTHYMEEASRCDLVGMLHRGRLLACDPPGTLKEATGKASLDDVFLALVRAPAPEKEAAP